VATRSLVVWPNAWGTKQYSAGKYRLQLFNWYLWRGAGHSTDALRATILEKFDMSLGAGLSKLADKVFRIGHLGHFNDLMLAGTLAGVEMGLGLSGVPHKEGGVMAALHSLARTSEPVASRA